MGERTLHYIPCPNCGETVEIYDAPSCLMYVGICEDCDWRDPKYYVEKDGVIYLIDPQKRNTEEHNGTT